MGTAADRLAVRLSGDLAFEHLEDRENPLQLFRLVQSRIEKRRLITMVEYFSDRNEADRRVKWLEENAKIAGWSIREFRVTE